MIYLYKGVLSGTTVAGTTASAGVWSYQLNSPTALIFDANGFMYILDTNNARIQKWWPGATYGTTLLTSSFATPLGMQLDRANNLIVADTSNHRIVSFGLLCRKCDDLFLEKEIINLLFYSSSFNNNNDSTT